MSNENKTALTAEEIIQDNLKKHKIQHFSSQGLKCVSDCMKVQIVGSLLDLLTPTKEERKEG